MLHTLPSELIALILNNLEPIEIINLGLTCKRLYWETNDHNLWKPYLIPALQITTAHPKLAFFENIEHCQIQFWHLHPSGLEAYQELKYITQHATTNIEKARWILRITDLEDYIEIIMALIHPEYRSIFSQHELNWPMMRLTILLVDKHPKILLCFLQDTHYRHACLTFYTTEPSFFINFRAIADGHEAITLDYQDSRDRNFEALLNHMIKQLCTRHTLEKRDLQPITRPRLHTINNTVHYSIPSLTYKNPKLTQLKP